MTRDEPIGEPIDEPVLEYLAAIEARRAAPPSFPEPDRLPGELTSGAMVRRDPAGDPEELRRDLAGHTPGSEANIERLENGFVGAAEDYGRRHGITYEGWIQAGVAPEVLERAGITPEAG